MILEFLLGGSSLLFGLSSSVGLSVGARATNFIFTPIEDLKKFKSFSRDQVKALRDTNNILNRLKSDDAKKNYVIREMEKLDGFFVGELNAEEYLKKFENNEFV